MHVADDQAFALTACCLEETVVAQPIVVTANVPIAATLRAPMHNHVATFGNRNQRRFVRAETTRLGKRRRL